LDIFLISWTGQLEFINGSTPLFPLLFVLGRIKYLRTPGVMDPESLFTLGLSAQGLSPRCSAFPAWSFLPCFPAAAFDEG